MLHFCCLLAGQSFLSPGSAVSTTGLSVVLNLGVSRMTANTGVNPSIQLTLNPNVFFTGNNASGIVPDPASKAFYDLCINKIAPDGSAACPSVGTSTSNWYAML